MDFYNFEFSKILVNKYIHILYFIGNIQRLHNEELHSLYRLLNKVRMIKSRRFRWAGHVARMEEGRSTFKIVTGKPTGKRSLERLGLDGRTILEWTLKKYVSMRGIGLIWRRIGTVGEPL